MSALVTDANVTPASLLPDMDKATGATGLDRIGQRYTPAITRLAAQAADPFAQLLAECGLEDCAIAPGPCDFTSFAAWKESECDDLVLLRYHAEPVLEEVIAVLPAQFLRRLIDIHFGGTGENAKKGGDFSPAEKLYLGRFTDKLAAALTTLFCDMGVARVTPHAMATQVSCCDFLKAHDLVCAQKNSVTFGGGNDTAITLLYPLSSLKSVPALGDADAMASVKGGDPEWRDSLKQTVMQVQLPMRTIFARPEISFDRLMRLKTGDVIPVFMPGQIPVSVAGRLFAHGTVGESNNRIAIKIEQIEQCVPGKTS